MDKAFKHFGFTLAEVLITLTIIGIIAAITIPTLISKYKKHELESRFKQASSLIFNAQTKMFADSTNPQSIINNYLNPETGARDVKYAISQIMPYFNVDVKDSNMILYNVKNNLKYKTYSGTNAALDPIDDGGFILKNGMTVWLNNGNFTFGIGIDTNGHKNPPNRYGYDTFFWTTTPPAGIPAYNDGRFYPLTSVSYSSCDRTSTHVWNGLGCTFSAATDSDYFKNLK